MNKLLLSLIISLLSLLAIAGCGPEAIEDLPPEEIISNSVVRMKAMEGYKFLIDRSGAFAFLDAGQTISFSRAEGNYVRPDRVIANVRVIAPGLVVEVEVVGIGSEQWQTNMLTREWEPMSDDIGFNPSALFHPETGIPSVFETDLSNMVLIGTEELEEIPGKQLYALSGLLAGEQIYQISFGLIGPDELNVKLWIAPETFELYRMVVIEPGQDGEEDTTWLLDFWAFDQTKEISPPLP